VANIGKPRRVIEVIPLEEPAPLQKPPVPEEAPEEVPA
jgi:hypothetical protein